MLFDHRIPPPCAPMILSNISPNYHSWFEKLCSLNKCQIPSGMLVLQTVLSVCEVTEPSCIWLLRSDTPYLPGVYLIKMLSPEG